MFQAILQQLLHCFLISCTLLVIKTVLQSYSVNAVQFPVTKMWCSVVKLQLGHSFLLSNNRLQYLKLGLSYPRLYLRSLWSWLLSDA